LDSYLTTWSTSDVHLTLKPRYEYLLRDKYLRLQLLPNAGH